MKRVKEELGLLKEEMQRVIDHWMLYKEKIIVTLANFSTGSESEDEANRGAQALLRRLQWEVDVNIAKTTETFSPILNATDDFESDSEESDVESDDEDYEPL